MKSIILVLLDTIISTGLLGVGLMLLALLDAWLHFRATGERRGFCLARLAVRLAFLIGCLWVTAVPVLSLLASQKAGLCPEGWSPHAYWMGLLGRADYILLAWAELVLAAFCMWLFATALMYAPRILFCWRQSRLQPERSKLPSIRDVSNFVSSLMLLGVLCGIWGALRLLHPS